MIPVAQPIIGEEEKKYVMRCLNSGWVSSRGEFVGRFERKFSSYCGSKRGVAVPSGTAALHLAFLSLGIGKKDEVIVSSLNYVSAANAVRYCNAKPVFVDVDKETWNIDPEKIREKITKNTKAVIATHLYGNPCDIEEIVDMGKDNGVFVVEDAAEAHGAEFRGKKVGSFGDVGCFSFAGNKVITTGEGGMIITNDDRLADKAAFIASQAESKEKKYWHTDIGFNYRLTNIQAALGLAQLRKINRFIRTRQKNAKLYNSLLQEIPVSLPNTTKHATNVYFLYSILIENGFGAPRDSVVKKLFDSGVDSRPFFCPLHTLPPYANAERLAVSESLSGKGISLPSSPKLTKDQIKFVCETLKSIAR